MSFSINTNVASLSAQNYLRINSNFQGQTINRVTSGLRIVQSGDDAAGLAIANGYRSDQAVLTQGVRNANDGLSQLQIADGGMNNISQLLDRARTLATQSASGTFTGDRGVLNDEFQSVMGEIDRQAQAIGLNNGGTFAKSLSVFIGGGKGLTSQSVISNGSVSIDLSKSTVDTKGLGLAVYQALGNPNSSMPVDLGDSSSTSVKKILANTANTANEATTNNTRFYFTGSGFSDSPTGTNPMYIDVNVAGVTDTDSLVTAINTAIQSAANPTTTTTESTAFKNAGITASIVTDSLGHKQLAFSSSNAAFQVQAGDNVANAFLGNFGTSANVLSATALSANSMVTGATYTTATPSTTATFSFSIAGGTAVSSGAISFTTAHTLDEVVSDLNSGVTGAASNNAATTLASAVTDAGIRAYNNNGKLAFTGPAGSTFEVQVSGDAADSLGFGKFNDVDGTSYDGAGNAIAASKTQGVEIIIDNQVIDLGLVTGGATSTAAFASLNTAMTNAGNAANVSAAQEALLTAAGITATGSANGSVKLTSTNGTNFRVFTYAGGTGDAFGWGASVAGSTAIAAGSIDYNASSYQQATTVNSGGAAQSTQFGDSKSFSWKDMATIGATNQAQTLTFSGMRTDGTQYSQQFTLSSANSSTLDAAVDTINSQLQQSNDSALQKIFAVKEQDGSGVEGIRFMSTEQFTVKIGAQTNPVLTNVEGISDGSSGATAQGELLNSETSTGAGVSDISNQTSAQAAVTALASAVTALGSSQAVVGRGENQFNYAINLAQSQLTNLATAESRIRDADLASEAANLTKAQILMQAGVAALAQANSAPQQVLSLLRS